MKACVGVRAEVEALLQATGLNATIVRPWYVLGPGHRWPRCFQPVYKVLERLPVTRDAAVRLGLVTLDQMIGTLIGTIEHLPRGVRIWGIPAIRRQGMMELT